MRVPILIPAATLVAGLHLAAAAEHRAIPQAALLLGLGLSLGGRSRRWIAPLALGLLCGWLADREPRWLPDPERPVELVGRLSGHWRKEPVGWLVALQGERLRQGERSGAWSTKVLLTLPGAAPPPLGRRFRARGYLRRAPAAANGLPSRPGPWRLWLKSRVFLTREEASGPMRCLVSASQHLRRRVGSLYDQGSRAHPGLAMARALVLGDTSEVPSAARRGLRRAGLAHLLALSGLHVGLVAGMVLLVSAGLPGPWRIALAVAATALYLLLAGPRPSLLRAVAMVMAAGGSVLLERPPNAANALAGVAAVMALAAPGLLGDLGFVLTIAATGGIPVVAPVLAERWVKLPSWLGRPLAVSAGAQLATLPWTLSTFHLLSPLAPLWNLLAVPWTALTLLVSLIWTGLSLVLPWAAPTALPLLDLLAAPFLAADRVPSILAPAIPLQVGWMEACGLTAALLAALLWPRRVGLAGAAAAALWLLAAGPSAADPELALLDVGQGEAILLRDRGQALLVDGGGWQRSDIGGRILLPVLASYGVRRLRALVLTHPDLDHCGGLVDIAAYLRVDEVWTAPGWRRSRCARELLTLPGIGRRYLWAGERASLGRWRLRALHPSAGDRAGSNDRSLVLVAAVHGRRVLLTGDLEAEGEGRILAGASSAEVACDILKVAHHGSRSSTTAAWLEATGPRLALISAGLRNRYGHPAAVVLERLEERRIAVLRTDRQGLIRIVIPRHGLLRIALPGAPRSRS